MTERLVRDFEPGFVVSDPDGPQATFRIAAEHERETVLLDKLRDEVNELAEGLSLESLADVMEVIGTVMTLKGWKNDDIAAARETKRKQAGGYSRFFLMRPVV